MKDGMNDVYAQALLDALTDQRNAALNDVVRLKAQLAQATAEIESLKQPTFPELEQK